MTFVSDSETLTALSFQIEYMSPLKKARIKQGLTIYEVAKKAGLRAPSVSRIERGYSTSAKTAERLARAVPGISEEMVLFPERFQKKSRKAA